VGLHEVSLHLLMLLQARIEVMLLPDLEGRLGLSRQPKQEKDWFDGTYDAYMLHYFPMRLACYFDHVAANDRWCSKEGK